MERDKRGRFIKKASGGTQLNSGDIITANDGKKYKLKSGFQLGWVKPLLEGSLNDATQYNNVLTQYFDPYTGSEPANDTVNVDGKTYKLKPNLQMSWVSPLLEGSKNNADAYNHYLTQYFDPVEENSSAGVVTPPATPEVPKVETPAPTTPTEGVSLNKGTSFNYSFNDPLGHTKPFNLNSGITTPSFSTSLTYDPNAEFNHVMSQKTGFTSGLSEQFNPGKVKVYNRDGKYITQYGKEISLATMDFNTHELVPDDTFKAPSLGSVLADARVKVAKEELEQDGDTSFGMNITDTPDPKSKNKLNWINKAKLSDFLQLTRAGIGYAVNNKIAERALEAEKPFLQDVYEGHRSVYGDYRSQVEGEKAAAQLRNLASKPITSDGALQQQMMLDAQIKGQQYVDQGRAKDEALIRQSREAAVQQEKENGQQRMAAAMQNRKAMLTTQANKAQIKNTRDSANYSQVLSPLLAGTEQRLRNKEVQKEKYQEYYDDALVTQEVWNSFRDNLTPEQVTLADKYKTGGLDAVKAYIGDDADGTKQEAFVQLQRIMNNEVIRRKAALKGVYINPLTTQQSSENFGIFSESDFASLFYKKGGTVYKAKLNKRTKDNDRASRSIESSKKLAARLLEKALDSLYDYGDIEIVEKPSRKKRKYQAGGNLPFVNFTPVFATSETGAPKEASAKEDKNDLTSKDVLKLLEDMDGLPTDMNQIVSALQSFQLMDSMDPLGMSSSSDITSRYISLINKIKVAKFNKEEYNAAFNQLKGNGGLNEYAVTSEGLLIGSNRDGDFEFFTPDQVNAGEPRKQGYSLLTNSNLLYLRANSPEAAFNHQLTTVAQNGIGMEVITKQVNEILQALGKSKEGEEGFIQMGAKEQIKNGVKFLQKAAKAVGDDGITENMSIADYYQAGYMTEDQAQQAKLALQYIWSALPQNAKSLLQVKGGGATGAEAIVQSLVYSKTSTDTSFKATPKKMSKESGSGSGSSGVDELKLSPVQMMQVGYTDHMPVTLQKGTKYAITVNAQVLPITDVNKKLLGITTLDRVAESTFGGALDMNNVTMGSQLIDPQALQNVQIDSTNLYVMNLPIDKNSPDGTIKPDLSWMTKIEEIDKIIRDKHITDIDEINKLYVEAGLPVLMNENGELNVKDYCKFGVLNGHALNSAFKDLDALDNSVLEMSDEDDIANVLSILNKGRGEKDRIKFDSESWWDSLFHTDHDSMYEGTIYIPIRTNAFTGMIGGGQYPDAETAEQVEALIQQKERTRGYVDPGLLM